MHHFVFHSRLRHAWFGRVLETAEHLHLRPKSAAVKFQRLFAATAEKQIWLHRCIRVSHTRSLGFLSLNVNVPLLNRNLLCAKVRRSDRKSMFTFGRGR